MAEACPITTGIFAWLAAVTSAEDEAKRSKRVTPYWRTLRNGGELNPKCPGGIELQTRRLVAEGHEVTSKGNRAFVKAYEKSLARL